MLGIYAPTEAPNRSLLWQELFMELDFSYKWIILGDFKMIEHPSNQQGGNPTVTSKEENVETGRSA